jgi:hypothetical protein
VAISVDPATKVISIPKADLTLISGNLYELDVAAFKVELGSLLDNEGYIWMEDAFEHNTEFEVAGTTFARTVQLINGYSVTFEDGNYAVRLAGANNNLFDMENDILNMNNVQVIAQNSAGLVNPGKPLSAQETRDAMGLDSTTNEASLDEKLNDNFAISAAGL